MFNFSKGEIVSIAKNNNFIKNNTEKVLRLCEILNYISSTNYKEYLVLKGGTAINLFIFELPRLSVDIDFDFNLNVAKEEMLVIREKIKKEIIGYMLDEGYSLSDNSKFVHTLDSFVFSYNTLSNSKDVLKIEINYSNRVHVFNPKADKKEISLKSIVKTTRLTDLELMGTKINAFILRTTPRDFYDVYNILQSNSIDYNIIKKIAIFYIVLSADVPIIFDDLLEKCLERVNSMNYNKFRETLIPLLHLQTKLKIEEMKEFVINNITRLFTLNDNEKLFISKFNEGIFEQKLLFEEYEVNDLSNHPMVIWKTMKH